jgi:intracellular sulfur oxidation DsrE/DsrF family protein
VTHTPAPRRDFLAQLAAAGLASAGLAACAPATAAGAAAGGGAPAPVPGGRFDDSWTAKVRAARHKAVFDAPEVQDGLGIFQAWLFRQGYREALGPAEAQAAVPVVVVRHAGTVLAMDDALWAKYKLGEIRKINDQVTNKPAERNPIARPRSDAPKPEGDMARIVAENGQPTIETLIGQGAVVLACNLALNQMIGVIARRTDQKVEDVRAEVHAGLVPGVILQPSGVYAVLRAQEAGCVYLRSTNVA